MRASALTAITAVLVLVVHGVLGGCRDQDRIEILTGEAMGTSYRIKHVGRVGDIEPVITAMLARLDRDLSTWRDDSWVSAFNRAPAGASFEMPPAVAELMDLSKTYHDQSGGRFDPTIGALIRLWGFGAWRGEWRGDPTDEEVAAAREASGFSKLRIEAAQITKLHGGLMLDFSGIAKGYAVDRMGDILREAGCENFVVECGGDLLAIGNAPGKQGWTIAGPALEQAVSLHNQAMAGSGSEHQFRSGLSHVIDPRGGRPLAVGPPVFAAAPTCAEADALATARLVESASPR